MAEFDVSCDGFDSKTVRTATPSAAARKYAETEIAKAAQPMDEDEYDIAVLCRDTGLIHNYTARVHVSINWSVIRKKEDDDRDAEEEEDAV